MLFVEFQCLDCNQNISHLFPLWSLSSTGFDWWTINLNFSDGYIGSLLPNLNLNNLVFDQLFLIKHRLRCYTREVVTCCICNASSPCWQLCKGELAQLGFHPWHSSAQVHLSAFSHNKAVFGIQSVLFTSLLVRVAFRLLVTQTIHTGRHRGFVTFRLLI